MNSESRASAVLSMTSELLPLSEELHHFIPSEYGGRVTPFTVLVQLAGEA